MIKLKGVSKYYKTKTGVSEGMRNINLELSLNEFVAVTGPSGSGKTTLLNVLSGLDSYEDGELYINNEETSHYGVKEWEEFRASNVGFVFQNYNVIDSYTVYQNVLIALEAQGYNEKSKKERALELIERVGLTSHKNQRTSKLSGGQKQRVVIARSLAKNAPIILADEPTGNLDEQTGKEIMALLKEVSKDKLIVLVTHDFNLAKDYVTRRIEMKDGSIKEDKVIDKSNTISDKEIITSNLDKKNKFLTASKIAIRNIFATPKRTVFTTLLSVLAIAVFLFFHASLISNQVGSIVSNQSDLIVYNRDKTSFNRESYTKMKQDLENKDIDVIVPFSINEVDFNGLYTTINTADSITKNNKITEGRMIENDNEIIVIEFYNSRENYELNKTYNLVLKDYMDNVIYQKSLTVVGFMEYDSNFSYNGFSSIIVHPTILYDDNFKVNSVFKSFRTYKKISEEVNYISILGSDRPSIELVREKIDQDKYQIIDGYLKSENEMGFVVGIFVIVQWLLLIGILSIVFLVIYNISKNVMESRKKDFSVYRSIGVSESEVALTIIFEQLFVAIFAIFITITMFEVLSIWIEDVRLVTRHIKVSDYFLVSTVFALFTLALGLKFNRKIFNITVIDSLKEDSK